MEAWAAQTVGQLDAEAVPLEVVGEHRGAQRVTVPCEHSHERLELVRLDPACRVGVDLTPDHLEAHEVRLQGKKHKTMSHKTMSLFWEEQHKVMNLEGGAHKVMRRTRGRGAVGPRGVEGVGGG